MCEGDIGQYVRIKPDSKQGSSYCMRTELYGIKQHGGMRLVIRETYKVIETFVRV